ncbi:hypothetical protein HZB60_07040 [candidate division KSB1 bacterium]|nr:hypothetical protein [candidate division KSB1 bacterium]
MIWLGALLLALLIVSLLPWGIQFSQVAGLRSARLIVAGVRVPLPRTLRRSGAASPALRDEPADSPESGPQVMWDEFADWISLARDVEWRNLYRAVQRQFRCVRIRIRRLDVTVATPDPALTGMAYGLALAGVSALPFSLATSLTADFTADRPRADFRVDVTVIPLRLTISSVRLLSMIPVRRMYALWTRKGGKLKEESR